MGLIPARPPVPRTGRGGNRDRDRVAQEAAERAAQDAVEAVVDAVKDAASNDEREQHHADAMRHDAERRAELERQEAQFPVPRVGDH